MSDTSSSAASFRAAPRLFAACVGAALLLGGIGPSLARQGAEATPAAAAPTPAPYLTDPAALQQALAAGTFNTWPEARLREVLSQIDATVLIDSALLLLTKRTSYTTVLTKNERLRGDLQETPDVIEIKYRRTPLAMYARYLEGEHVDRQILYNDKARPGDITVAEPSLVGTLSLHIPVNSSLTRRSTNHSMMEMGLEFPLATMRREVELLKADGHPPNLGDGRLVLANGMRLWEISVKTPGPPRYYAAWSKLRFDVATALVADMEIRDANGLLLESFSYKGTRWGAHPESTFDEHNPDYPF